jgi:coenzyme F420-dependent glucose-6-phosphate dehydrogenase
MTRYGFHASHEQHSPDKLLEHVRAAESAGFEAAMCSDHFHPWLDEQGESGFAWAWLGAALEATSLSFGTVTAPGWRYHPAVVAQGAATLAVMYPGRFWLAIGSGEALNESITGLPWPPKHERTSQLAECGDVMHRLWRGETVNHDGRFSVRNAKLYSRPKSPPVLYAAALHAETAAAVAPWADALLTIGGERDAVREVIEAFRANGGEGKPVGLQHVVSWAPTDREAREQAHQQWRQSVLGDLLSELPTPAAFSDAARKVTAAEVEQVVRVSSDPDRHAAWLAAYAELGVDDVYIMNAGKNQEQYIEAFGAKVLPQLR